MNERTSFERVFKLTGTHLAAAVLGVAAAIAIFSPHARRSPVDVRTARVLELGKQAAAAASASAGPAPERAIALCRELGWPDCTEASVRQMGAVP